MMFRFAPLAFTTCLLLAAGAAAAKAPVDAQLLKRGRAIAQENCGRCHAVGPRGESANPKSPPFRHLARKYPLNNLEEALAEGIVVGHEGVEMPPFRLSAAQIEALLVYLNSIQR
ncbi:cytochrome c [Methylocystis sp. SB2]|uniref:c-type cytochrome n=1 Tax=Methylocystis sp. (strain SB2) TaxID=743836 RepID=UPI0004012882